MVIHLDEDQKDLRQEIKPINVEQRNTKEQLIQMRRENEKYNVNAPILHEKTAVEY